MPDGLKRYTAVCGCRRQARVAHQSPPCALFLIRIVIQFIKSIRLDSSGVEAHKFNTSINSTDTRCVSRRLTSE